MVSRDIDESDDERFIAGGRRRVDEDKEFDVASHIQGGGSDTNFNDAQWKGCSGYVNDNGATRSDRHVHSGYNCSSAHSSQLSIPTTV